MQTHIKLKTEIPGPRSRAFFERRRRALSTALFNTTPIFIERGDGAVVTDVDGNRLLDFSSGIGVLNVGHAADPVVQAVREQVGKFTHSCFHVLAYEPAVALAEKLNAVAPGTFRKKCMFANSGAEAVENAVKLARYFTKRPAIVAFEHGFHGRTNLCMTLTGKVHPYKAGFGPLAAEVYHAPFPYRFRCAHCTHREGCTMACFEDFLDFFNTHVDPGQVAAVIFEPVLGEGGFLSLPDEFVDGLVRFCRQREILIIADEVQSGWARTGRWFACEHYGLEPDLLVTAKSLAGGLPLSAVVGRAEILDAPHVGGLGGTYGGNPVACAAALATLHMIEDEHLNERAAQLGELMAGYLQKLQDKHPLVGEVRGVGAMQALELVRDRHTKEPAESETKAVIQRCYEQGLIVLKAGTHGNVIRLLPPLVIADDQLLEGLETLDAAIGAVHAQ